MDEGVRERGPRQQITNPQPAGVGLVSAKKSRWNFEPIGAIQNILANVVPKESKNKVKVQQEGWNVDSKDIHVQNHNYKGISGESDRKLKSYESKDANMRQQKENL